MSSGNYSAQRSLYQVLRDSEAFHYDPPKFKCNVCSGDFDERVTKAVADAENDFHGLCLTCMDGKKERNWALNDEYKSNGIALEDRKCVLAEEL